jgi:hypothetical protein
MEEDCSGSQCLQRTEVLEKEEENKKKKKKRKKKATESVEIPC